MNNATHTVPEGHRRNGQGHLVPEEQIRPIDKLRDDLVLALVAQIREQQDRLAQFKLAAERQITDFLDLSAEEYGVEWGGAKGNVTLTSFCGRYKILRAVGEHRVFDERIQAAKALVDKCIGKWTDGARSELKALIEHAFRVNKQGRIDVNQVLSLRSLSIDDPDWKQAMEAIADAIQISGTSQYLRVYERQASGRYTQIALDPTRL